MHGKRRLKNHVKLRPMIFKLTHYIGHGGGFTGIDNMFQWSPELDCGVIVLCNTSEFTAAAIAGAAMKLAMGKDSKAYEKPYTYEKWNKATLNSAIGFYKSGKGAAYEIDYKNDKINLKLNGEEVDVYPVRKDILLIKKPYNTTDLILCKNNEGMVWGVRVNGRIIPKSGV